jgi:hypothetical protein
MITDTPSAHGAASHQRQSCDRPDPPTSGAIPLTRFAVIVCIKSVNIGRILQVLALGALASSKVGAVQIICSCVNWG